MCKLVLHSDQLLDKPEMDQSSLQLFQSENPKIAYIPSQSDLGRSFFNSRVEYYKQFGLTNLVYCDIDQEYNKSIKEKILSCDGIFLSGGNTYYFLNNLYKRELISHIKKFVKNGGVLIGVSAGSILMSKTIEMASFHDQNIIGLKNLSSLGLVDFDFFPHLNWNKEKFLNDLLAYSKRKNTTIYACNDGDGIIVNGDDIQLFGDVIKIHNGKIKS